MNKKLILLPVVAMMLVGCGSKKPAPSPAPQPEPPAPVEPQLVFTINKDSIPDLADDSGKFDGTTYLKDASEFTVAERTFVTSGGKTFGRAAQSFAPGSYELKAMQMKKNGGYIESKTAISGFKSLSVTFVTTYDVNPPEKLLVLSHKASETAEYAEVASKEPAGTDLVGVDTGKKDGEDKSKTVYKFELHYENLTEGFYKFAAPASNATYPVSFSFFN